MRSIRPITVRAMITTSLCGIAAAAALAGQRPTVEGKHSSAAQNGATKAGQRLLLKVDWPEFMDRHKLVWEIFPARWENSLFIGNGIVGATIHATVDLDRVTWYLGRSDVGRLDYTYATKGVPARIQIGSMDLKTVGKILPAESSAELDIWNGEARGLIRTTRGEIRWRSFTALDEPVIMVELTDIKGDESQCRWAGNFTCEGRSEVLDGVHAHQVEDTQHGSWSGVLSGGHSVAWKEDASPAIRRLYVSVSSSPATKSIWDKSPRGQLSSLEDARRSIENARRKDIRTLESEHRQWWHDFYRKSFVSLPRLDLESYYWIQLYRMASSSRKGFPMIDNHGIWSVSPLYAYATWDLNVQMTYRLHLKSNHLELGEPLVRFLDNSFNEETMWSKEHGELRAGLRQRTFLRYWFSDTKYWEHPTSQPADGPAKFLWGCHNYWLQYRYSMDASMLKRLLPKLEGGINAMAAVLVEEADGRLHIPSGRNWENWIGKDPTVLLAVLDWALATARGIGEKLDHDKDKLARWEYLQSHLVDFPTGKYPDGSTGYLLGGKFHFLQQGKFSPDEVGEAPLEHRHWSHLLMIFPLQTVTWEQEDKRELIRNSVDYWSFISAGLNGKPAMGGYTIVAPICFYAGMGQTDRIPGLIDTFLYEQREGGLHRTGNLLPNVWANTMYSEHTPTIETPLFFASSLQELLLQSHGGVIRVFPAMPAGWTEAVFHDYRAEGGFLISAKYRGSKTEFIRIESLAGEPCLLQTTMESLACADPSDLAKIGRLAENRYRIDLAAGESILLFDGRSGSDFTIEPVADQQGSKHAYGLNKAFLEKRGYMLQGSEADPQGL